jgi:S1-C subfamily serine protease
VVAGTRQVGVQVSASDVLPATVVLYDSRRDVAVLDVPQLNAPALRFAPAAAKRGDSAVVLGYPEDKGFTVRAARIRSEQMVSGNDIYGHHSVSRDVYSVRAIVRSGNSGGPLLSYSGTVYGMVFATALDSADTGYALSVSEIRADAVAGKTLTDPVGTGACTPG